MGLVQSRPKALKRLTRKLLKLEVPLEHRVGLKWLIETNNVDNRTFSAEDFSRSVVSSIVFSVRSLNERKPVGIIIEDIEESNPILKLVLSSLLDDAVKENILVIMTSRPIGRLRIKRFMLDPLEEDAVMELADRYFLGRVSMQMSLELPGSRCGCTSATTIKQMNASELDISLRSPESQIDF